MKENIIIIMQQILIVTQFAVVIYSGYSLQTSLGEFNNVLTFEKNKYIFETINDPNTVNKTKTMGIYSPNTQIYCAWADYKDLKDKYNIDCHEYLHHLIYNGTCNGVTCWQHFCNLSD